VDEKGLLAMGERIFNLQRAILIRQGWGGRMGDNLMGYLFKEPILTTFFDPELLVPDQNGQPASRKGAILDKYEFERLKDEYYQLRGWDITSGLPTSAKMQSMDLSDIDRELQPTASSK
jgi:aldehyde:ferredoxin oxidoreductase